MPPLDKPSAEILADFENPDSDAQYVLNTAKDRLNNEWKGLSAEEVFEKIITAFEGEDFHADLVKYQGYFLDQIKAVGYPSAAEQVAQVDEFFEYKNLKTAYEQWESPQTLQALIENLENSSDKAAQALAVLLKKTKGLNAKFEAFKIKYRTDLLNSPEAEQIAQVQREIQQDVVYTAFGAKSYFEELFAAQKEALKSAVDPVAIQKKHLQTLRQLRRDIRAFDETTKGIDQAFVYLFGESIWDEANQALFDAIASAKDGKVDTKKALSLSEKNAQMIRLEKEKLEKTQHYLSQPQTLDRTVAHLFDAELSPTDVDIEKVWKMFESSDHLGLAIDPKLKVYFERNFLPSFQSQVTDRYREALSKNSSRVDETYAKILSDARQQTFKGKEAYGTFIAQQMQDRLGDFYAKKPKLLPDSVWEGKKLQRFNEAERNWEDYINNGEKTVWDHLNQALRESEKQKFDSKDAYIAFLKKTTGTLSKKKFLPDEVWDLRIKDRFRDRANFLWEKRLEVSRKKTWDQINEKMRDGARMKFLTKKEMLDFLYEWNTKDNQVPYETWKNEFQKPFNSMAEVLWKRRETDILVDSKQVQKIMSQVSLASEKINGKPRTEADFIKIAKSQLSSKIKGKITDEAWDTHMQAYFYPRVESELRANEAALKQAMMQFKAPKAKDRLACKNEAQYLDLVKTQFAANNAKLMGLVPNGRYDQLRDSTLLARAREQWRNHEASEEAALSTAKAALNHENLLKTVHHFAKNKQIPNPTIAEVKTSSSHALASQFKLRPDQLKALDDDLQQYAAQVRTLYDGRRSSALKTVKAYRVPDGASFNQAELGSPKDFHAALQKKVGDMNFTHIDDWYLVKNDADAYIEDLWQQQVAKEKEVAEAANDNVSEETETVVETNLEQGSEDLDATQKETSKEHPAEQTPWMKRFGIAPDAVSAKGAERFDRVMNLPEFNLGGIPNSDLRIAVPVLVNMLGGFRETTWKNFTTRIRDDLRSLKNKDPQSRFYQIIKSFAVGYPYKETDFDKVPGLDNVFNNLVKRTKGPEGEKFTTIKNMYRHFFKPADRLALDEELSEEDIAEFEALWEEEVKAESVFADEAIEVTEDTDEDFSEDVIEEIDQDLAVEELSYPEAEEVIEEIVEEIEAEVLESGLEIESDLAAEDLEAIELNQELDTEETIAEEILETELNNEELAEIEIEKAVEEPDNQAELVEVEGEELTLEPSEAADELIENEADETLESEAEEILETDIEPVESGAADVVEEAATEDVDNDLSELDEITQTEADIDTEPNTAYQDYLKEGAVVLTEVDNILTEVVDSDDEVVDEKLQKIVGTNEQAELRPEEQAVALTEAAEVLPEKLYKILIKLRASGLLSAEALAWLIDQGTEFYVTDQSQDLSLAGALKLIEISQRSRFLGGKFIIQTKLTERILEKRVQNLDIFIRDFVAFLNAIDGVQSMAIKRWKQGRLQGVVKTRIEEHPLSIACELNTHKLRTGRQT